MDSNETTWTKDVTVFLASQTLSLFGTSLVQYAITWYITLTTQSGVMMTISIVCGFLPTFFVSPFAGVWADRYHRRTLIILADSTIAVSTLVLAILFYMGYGTVWLLFVISAIRAFGTGIQTPAVGAFIPQLVPQDELTRVNATNSSIQSLVALVSPMVSGALLTMASIETVFFIDVVTAATAVSILLLFLHVPAHAKASNRQRISYWGDMREGIAYVRNHGFVRTVLLFNAVFFTLVTPLAFLTPLQVTRSFGDDVWRLTAIEVSFSAGMTVGGIIMASWGGLENKVHSMILANLVIALCTFALGIPPVFWVYLLLMGVIGLALPVFNTPFMVLMQQKVEGDFLGRVFGLVGMIASVTMPMSMLVFGPVADLIRIEWLLLGTGLLMVVQCLFMLGNRVLVEAGKPV